jgi:5-dehydro-2-deoxygluconokinase
MYRNMAADLSLDPADIDEEYIKEAKAVLLSGTALAASPSREAVFKVAALAKKNGVRIIFDIDYRAYNWKSKDEIAICYSKAAQEADIILGSRQEFDLMESLLGLDGTDKASAEYWFGKGAKIVITNTYVDGKDVDTSRFFERFYRQDESHNSEKSGFGIGLSMAKEITERMKGKLRVNYSGDTISFTVEV